MDKQKRKKNNSIIKRVMIMMVIVLILLPFFYYENHHLVVSEYDYTSDRIAKGLDGFCIVQISDFHNARFGKDNRNILEKIQSIDPDIIVFTGDIVDSTITKVHVTTDFVYALKDICPMYYVTGNHEYLLSDAEKKELFEGLENAGVKVLDNEAEVITKDEASFTLIGIDDNCLQGNTLKNIIENNIKADEASNNEGMNNLSNSTDMLNVVLAHEPQYIDNYSRANANLVLSGHAHGGQFRLPFVGGVVAPGQGFNPKYTEGRHIMGNTEMIISRGLGNSIIPIRLFNDPEIVVVRLRSGKPE